MKPEVRDVINNINRFIQEQKYINVSSNLKMEENAEIKWWIRIYMDDKVIDLSYLKIERELSK